MAVTIRYWIVVASKDHVMKGVEGGFIQANHGKKAPMQHLRDGDFVICYSPRKEFNGTEPYRKFTALGQIVGTEVTQGAMEGGKFKPFRRTIKYFSCKETPVKPLIGQLTFIRDPKKWGFPFMRGFFEIAAQDFWCIANQMDYHG